MARALGFILNRTGLGARLRQMWRRDITGAVTAADGSTAKIVKKLQRQVEDGGAWRRAGEARLRDTEKRLAQADATIRHLAQRLGDLERAAAADAQQTRLVVEWQQRFKAAEICAHVTSAVARTPLVETPAAHLLVGQLFPPDFYDLLLASLPGPDLFERRAPVELNLRPAQFGIAPRLTRLLWEFVDTDVASALMDAAIVRLSRFIEARCQTLVGRERAETMLGLPHEPFGGCLTLRSPGYREKPHCDPKRASVTVFVYLARPGDPEAAGTALYSIDGDFAPVRTGTSYPEAHGLVVTPASRVPFRPNSALILVNAGAAHAAEVPDDVVPPGFLRYVFQFHIGPNAARLLDFASALPPADQQQWLGLPGELDA